MVELLACRPGKFNKHRDGAIWNMNPHCLMWSTWQERNSQIFEGTKKSIHDLIWFFFQTLLGWTNALGVYNFTSLSDLLDSCTFSSTFFFFFNHHTPCVLRPLYLRCLIKVFITYQNSLNFKISVNVALLKVGH